MESLRKAWVRMPAWQGGASPPTTAISVVVPARNEAANLERCLTSLLEQDYPKELLEIIVADDFSEDATADIARSLAGRGVRLVHPERPSKKKALEAGIAAARGTVIASIDGDSWASPSWLREMAGYYELHRPVLLAGPVHFTNDETALGRFQALDMLGMTGVAAAGISLNWFHLGNGANLMYERQAFFSIGGFSGVDRFASGDDVFLMQKMAEAFPGRLAYLKSAEAVVHTPPAGSWGAFWQQRLRWGGKASHYREWRLTAVAALTLACSWAILIAPFFSLWAFGVALALKTWADYRFLNRMSRFFRKERLSPFFWEAQLPHILYIALTGAAAVFWKSYEWKGRHIDK